MYQQKPQPKPKIEKEDCEIEVRKTRTGKKVRISGKCTREQLKVFAQENNLDLE